MELYQIEETNKLRRIVNWIVDLVVVLSLAWLVVHELGAQIRIVGQSMTPELRGGDVVLMDQLTYDFEEPQRFDVVVFEREDHKDNVKRIIGLPGETVQIDEQGNIYIDGEVLPENYGREIIRPDTVGIATNPIVLGEEEYFVMGDNRNNSTDSRTEIVGNIKREDIIGRAWVRIWPLNKIGILKHQ